MAEQRYYASQGEDENYRWGSDHVYIRVTGEHTNGAYAIVEDNMVAGFYLPPHYHKEHAETFIVLAGEIEYTVDDEVIKGTPGTVLYVAPGVPHAARALVPSKALMVFSPAGFENLLREVNALGEQANEPETMQRLNEKYDIVPLK